MVVFALIISGLRCEFSLFTHANTNIVSTSWFAKTARQDWDASSLNKKKKIKERKASTLESQWANMRVCAEGCRHRGYRPVSYVTLQRRRGPAVDLVQHSAPWACFRYGVRDARALSAEPRSAGVKARPNISALETKLRWNLYTHFSSLLVIFSLLLFPNS